MLWEKLQRTSFFPFPNLLSLQRSYGVTVAPRITTKKVIPKLPLDIAENSEKLLYKWMQDKKLRPDLESRHYYKALRCITSRSRLPKFMIPPDYNSLPDRFTSVQHLSTRLVKHGGRNHTGIITVRHRGGGCKRRLRLIDMSREVTDPEQILRIEYDPNRSGRIALVRNMRTQQLSYILAPDGIAPGQILTNDAKGNVGNTMMLQDLPDESSVYNIEIKPNGGGRMVRSAGTRAIIVSKVFSVDPPIIRPRSSKHGVGLSNRVRKKLGLKRVKSAMLLKEEAEREEEAKRNGDGESAPVSVDSSATASSSSSSVSSLADDDGEKGADRKEVEAVISSTSKEVLRREPRPVFPALPAKEASWWVIVRLPSADLRVFPGMCKAMIGRVSNVDHNKRILGKAGRRRRLGWRPSVRGVAMNACDHPHGGTDGHQQGGLTRNIWGKIVK